jgi:hypothetical protein
MIKLVQIFFVEQPDTIQEYFYVLKIRILIKIHIVFSANIVEKKLSIRISFIFNGLNCYRNCYPLQKRSSRTELSIIFQIIISFYFIDICIYVFYTHIILIVICYFYTKN